VYRRLRPRDSFTGARHCEGLTNLNTDTLNRKPQLNPGSHTGCELPNPISLRSSRALSLLRCPSSRPKP
jgi:hypothetical protein